MALRGAVRDIRGERPEESICEAYSNAKVHVLSVCYFLQVSSASWDRKVQCHSRERKSLRQSRTSPQKRFLKGSILGNARRHESSARSS